MQGPYNFTRSNVQQLSKFAGAYILGKWRNGKYEADYVGRSDDRIKSRLLDHINGGVNNDCLERRNPNVFWIEYTQSAYGAYSLECRWYHKYIYTPLCNDVHPAKTLASWRCPICNQ